MLRNALLIAGLAASPFAFGLSMAYAADGTGCQVVDGTGRCLVAAVDPGRPGGPSHSTAVAPTSSPTKPKARKISPARPSVLPTPAPLSRLAIDSTKAGALAGFQRDPASRAPTAPIATRTMLERTAVNSLDLAAPGIHLSTSTSAFVGVPVWMWVEEPNVHPSATAAVGNARVDAEAVLEGVEWFMGPPGATVTCDGPGTPWTGQSGSSPDCGYIYTQRSLPARTGGTGTWTVTATSVWHITWNGVSAGAPVNGQQIVRIPAEMDLRVGEVQVLVDGGS